MGSENQHVHFFQFLKNNTLYLYFTSQINVSWFKNISIVVFNNKTKLLKYVIKKIQRFTVHAAFNAMTSWI